MLFYKNNYVNKYKIKILVNIVIINNNVFLNIYKKKIILIK